LVLPLAGTCQLQLYGLAASEQITVELTRKSTRLTASLPGVTDAVIETVDLRCTVVPFAGLVIETCGSVGASTVIGTVAEVPVFPAASLAVAERECEPGDVVLQSHVMV